MKDLPEDLDERDLIASLADGWGLEVAGIRSLDVGFGSYHWVAKEADGKRHFITVDDLDQKSYLGASRDSSFEGLRCAFNSALALRHEGRLEFVTAPRPARGGETVNRIGSRYAVAVFPFVDGTTRQFGERVPPAERAELVRVLARLHHATPSVASIARRAKVQLPGRDALESALHDLDRAWTGGPFSEPARALLAGHRRGIERRLEDFDQLSGQVAAAGTKPVITHGEPHAGNIIRADGQLVLVDWDTVCLAPPERDLWMVDSGAGDDLKLYAEVSGRQVDDAAIALFRLRWTLDDIASFTKGFRSEHGQTADAELAWVSLGKSLQLVRDS